MLRFAFFIAPDATTDTPVAASASALEPKSQEPPDTDYEHKAAHATRWISSSELSKSRVWASVARVVCASSRSRTATCALGPLM